MRSHTPTVVGTLLLWFFLLPVPFLLAVGTNPEVTGADTVLLLGPDATKALAEVLAGTGVPGIASPSLPVADGGRVEWVLIRDETDEIGMHHRFYHQVYRPAPRSFPNLESQYGSAGIPLLGSEIGIHGREGTVSVVFGTQFRHVTLANGPLLGNAADAMSAAEAVLGEMEGFATTPWRQWSPEFTQAQLRRVNPLLLSQGDGRTFKVVWEIPTVDDSAIPGAKYLDAATASPLGVETRRLSANDRCTPDPGHPAVSALGKPQWTSLADRNIAATADPERQPDFTHEAHWPANPTFEVLQYFRFDDPGYGVYNCPGWSTGLVPLRTVSGSVRLDDWPGFPIKGRAAADAAYYTKQTMGVFYNNLYRYSYDGSGGDAVVVTDVKLPTSCDNSEFRLDQCDATAVPCNSVLVYQPCSGTHLPVAVVACLDTVAHEWGHGVVRTSASFPYGEGRDPVYGTVGAQLHEGFADVIGYAVEWYAQPKASNPNNPPLEQADWLFQEDCGWDQIPQHPRWKRRVDQPHTSGAFHRLDQVGNTEAHFRGNALAVAYRMMYDGAANPDGARFGTDGIVPPKLDRDRSTRILFRVLTRLATSTTPWWALPDLGKQAAFDLYSFCSVGYSATTEQDSVVKAFLGVGYQGITQGFLQCR